MSPEKLPLTQASLRIKSAVDSGRIRPSPADGMVVGARGSLLKPRRDRSGFLMVSFGSDYAYIHRIIAYAAFGDNALLPGMQVIHLDGDKTNNRAANLKVVSLQERGRSAGRKSPGMAWKVLDPVTGSAIAHFASQLLAEEYARFKFGSEHLARSRKPVSSGGAS
jgi:hypothetical protein